MPRTAWRKPQLLALLGFLALVRSLPAQERNPAVLERDPTDLGVPFERYSTKDRFGRRITFYLSITSSRERLPLVVFIQGSGCQSLFQKRGERVQGGLQMLVLQAVKDRARVLVVEKPGVKYLDQAKRPGSAEGASQEFLEEHTLPRWAEANGAALRAVQTLPVIDTSRTLVMGHSEGAIVAARVAAENPKVSHVAGLAGGGPTQLFSLAELARARAAEKQTSTGDADPAEKVYEAWRQIQADPESVTKFFMGHPYRRWSSFLKSSVRDELQRSKARIYLAHGTRDQASPVASFDVLRAELLAQGRDVTAERIAGADHGFVRDGDAGREGMVKVFTNVVEWFLKPPTK